MKKGDTTDARSAPVTSTDVARAAGVSRAAVSQILNGRGERFSPATRERVVQAARDLRYQPSAAARTLARGSSEIIVALLPNATFGGTIQDLLDTLTDELSALGLTLVMRFSTSSPESFDRLVRTMHPLAVVTLTRVGDDDRRLLLDRGVRIIEPDAGQVERVDYTIGQMQAEYLIGRGYRHLAYARLRDRRGDPFGNAREAGAREACRRHGLDEPTTVSLAVDGTQALDIVNSLPVGCGVACYNDDVALALLSAAHRAQRRMPDELALIGMDNTPMSALAYPRLTTIEADVRSGAHGMARIIVEAVRNDAPIPVGEQASVPLRIIDGDTA